MPLNKKVIYLSTGLQAKLTLLQALSHEAEILLLDEPTFGLDLVVRNERTYYWGNYPNLAVEKGSIDEALLLLPKEKER